MNETKKPAIRFNEFMDAWEQRKIGECFSERIESFPEGELLSVTINSGVRKFCELGRNDNSNDDKSKYKKVCIGDIAYNSMRMWQGASGYSPYIGIVSPAYTVLSPKPSIDSKCLAYQLKLPSIIHTFQVNSQGITSDNWNLKYPSLSKIDIIISPDKKEQEQISHFFSNIDTTIAAYQSRFEKLQSLKSAMLEKMFPKDGANVPEIRFKGFTGSWKRVKIGDISEIITGGTPNTERQEYWEPKEIPWLSSGEIHKKRITFTNDKISEFGFENSGARWVKANSLLIALAGQGKTRGTVAITKIPITTNQSIAAIYFNSTIVPDFALANLEGRYNEIRTMSYGDGARGGLNKQLVSEIVIPYPSISEQKKIATLFEGLDCLITHHQQQLEKLQSIKKALLEKMFV